MMNAEEKAAQEILAKYPQAIKITEENLEVGDVVCNHPRVPCIFITEEIYDQSKQILQGAYIVAKTQ